MYSLPKSNPNYVLFLETNLTPVFVYTVQLHFGYVKKVLRLPEGRLPNYLARTCMKYNVYRAKEWDSLVSRYGIPLRKDRELSDWTTPIKESIALVTEATVMEFRQRALSAQRHPQYLAMIERGSIVPLEGLGDFWFGRWLQKIRGGRQRTNSLSVDAVR